MSNYTPTPGINVPRFGWDDPNAQEFTCINCGGFVGVPGRIYGLVATWCVCGNPQKTKKPSVEALRKAQKSLNDFYNREPSEELLKILVECFK